MKNKVINKNFGTNNIITCDNVTITLGSKKNPQVLIGNFNFAFAKNKIYAIVGNSGVGKTTLVSHLNGLIKTRRGDIYIKDRVILGKDRKVKDYKNIRKDISLVFQFPEYQIFKDTVEKDIAFGPINNHVNKEKAKKLASKYMYLVGLKQDLLKANPFDLSNGQKRLVAIAGVLALDSDIVVFDEPTAGLDPSYQKTILKIIKELKRKGKTIIIITHNMDNVLELADEVLVLHNKKLIKYGKPYDVFANTRLLNEIGLDKPHIIKAIDKLINKNKKYKKLLELQPKTFDQLVSYIKKGGF